MLLKTINIFKIIFIAALILFIDVYAQEKYDKEKYEKTIRKGNEYFNEACVNSLSLIDVKNFDLAQKYYKEALKIKKGDPFSENKLEKIKKIFQKHKGKMERAYIRNIRDGERFIKYKKFTLAKAHFINAIEIKTAMGISPDNDSYPNDMLKKIDQLIEEEKKKIICNGFFELSRNLMLEKKFYKARKHLKKNLKLFPKNQKLTDLLKKSEIKIAEYEEMIKKAEEFYSSRQFDSSKVYYEKAYIVYPHERSTIYLKSGNIIVKENAEKDEEASSFNALCTIPGFIRLKNKNYIAGSSYIGGVIASTGWFFSAADQLDIAEDDKKRITENYSGILLEQLKKPVQRRIDAYESKKIFAMTALGSTLLLNTLDACGYSEYIPGNYHFNNNRNAEGWLLSSIFLGSSVFYFYAVNDYYDRKAADFDTDEIKLLKNGALGILCSTFIYNIWDLWRSGNFSNGNITIRESDNIALQPVGGVTSNGVATFGLQIRW